MPSGRAATTPSDLFEARKFAEDLYDEFLLKIKLGQSITGHNLGKMVEEYETHIRAKGEPTKRELAILAFLKTYPLPYFTKNKITEITPAEVSRFFDWRRTHSVKKAPRETTILHETSMHITMAKKIPPLLKYNKSNLKRVVTAIIRNLDHDLLSRQYKAQNLINPMHGHCHNATGTLYKIFRSDNVHAFRGIDKTGTYHW